MILIISIWFLFRDRLYATLMSLTWKEIFFRHSIYNIVACTARALAAWVAMGNPWLTHSITSSHPAPLTLSLLFSSFFLSLFLSCTLSLFLLVPFCFFFLFLSCVGLSDVTVTALELRNWRSISRERNFGFRSAASSHDYAAVLEKRRSIKPWTMSSFHFFWQHLQLQGAIVKNTLE